MVTRTSLLLFLAASLPLVLFPGPAVAFILGTALRNGRRAGLAATAGVETGYLVHVLGAVVGVSAIIATTATAFSVVKVAGAAWLLWLAWQSWRRDEPGSLGDLGSGTDVMPARKALTRGLLVGALNPKTAVFYLAFLPQFVSPDGGPVWAQLLIFGLAFIVLAGCFDAMWAIGAGGLRRLLPALRIRLVDRASAVVYAALAFFTLTVRRAT